MLFILFSYFATSEFRKDQSYSVSVKSKYAAIPIFDQILFFLADFSPKISSSYLREVLKSGSNINNEEFLFSAISNHIPHSLVNLLKSFIDTNYYLPRIEMFRSIARELTQLDKGDTALDLFICASSNLETIIKSKKMSSNLLTLYSNDAKYIGGVDLIISGRPNKETNNIIYIYANFEGNMINNNNNNVIELLNLFSENELCLVLRPISSFPQKENAKSEIFTNLRGYGVEMRPFKYSMEYGGLNTNSNNMNITEGKVKKDETTKGINILGDIPISDFMDYSEIPIFGNRFTSFLKEYQHQLKDAYNENNYTTELPEIIRDMSNNWPVFLRKIADFDSTSEGSSDYRKVSEIFDNKQVNQFPISILNGRSLPINNIDIFSFLDIIKEENTFLEILKNKYNITQQKKKLSIFDKSYIQDANFLLDYRTKHSIWNTDFETDPQYAEWSTDIRDMTTKIRKNMLNFVLYIDISNPVHITELFTAYVLSTQGGMPLRIGVVPYFNLGNRLSRKVSFAFAHLSLIKESEAIEFLIRTLTNCGINRETQKLNELKEEHFIQAYASIDFKKASKSGEKVGNKGNLDGKKKVDWNDLYTLYGMNSNEYKMIKESNEYMKYCGARLGTMTINGKQISLASGFQNFIMQIQQMLLSIRKLCLQNGIFDIKDVDIVDLLSNEYLVVPSIDSKVYDNQIRGIGLFRMTFEKQLEFTQILEKIEWNHTDDANLKSYYILFKPQESSYENNFSYPENQQSDENTVNNNIVNDVFEEFMNNRELHSVSTAFAINPPNLREFLNIKENETSLMVNGRIYKNIEKFINISQLKLIDLWSYHFTINYIKQYDIEVFGNISDPKSAFNARNYLSAVLIDWRNSGINRISFSSLITSTNSENNNNDNDNNDSDNTNKNLDNFETHNEDENYDNNKKKEEENTLFDDDNSLCYRKSNPVEMNEIKSSLEWTLIVDPFNKDFQKIIDFVNYLNKKNVISLKLILVPPQMLSKDQEKELNSFFRMNIADEHVTFSYLNDTTTYSTILETPQSWLLEILKSSIEDIDNVRLELLKSNSDHYSSFLLSSLVIEGKCFTGMLAPPYLEIGLFDYINVNQDDKITIQNKKKKISETTVMPTSSYFQFLAHPGSFRVELSTERSKELYESPIISYENQINLFSFSKKEYLAFFSPKPTSNFDINHLSHTYGTNSQYYHQNRNKTMNQINIFTIASGRTYERLAKIMFLSVRKNTKSKVMFYLIKTFLSPSFKASLPNMSKNYGFSYKFVDYKWPSWLRKQSDKQRIIWGSKILFLDVLFPLEVSRILYVDADQIVRYDLQELMDLDFVNLDPEKRSPPYAFAPFCDSRTETEKFRFWKEGYWQQTLNANSKSNKQQRKYHISALFAVDMARFKEMNAGDWLRLNYQQLSNDPNSLANLDQDLPNSMQEQVPIFSLEENWLWCETWCADEEMEKAKTIDLCNNPLTKVPKIEIAKKRVKEWPSLDEEAKKTDAKYDEYERFLIKNIQRVQQ